MKRTLAEFGGREGLWPAELKILDEAPTGQIVTLGRVSVSPKAFGQKNQRVRASFIRYLALGGCTVSGPCEKGLRIRGAFVVGDNTAKGAETQGLDLEGCDLVGELLLTWCVFPDRVIMRFVEANSVTFDKSRFDEGLTLRGARIKENMNLRAVECLDELSLSHAQLGGDLVLDGAYLRAGKYSEIDVAVDTELKLEEQQKDVFALVAQNMSVRGGFMFREQVRYKKARKSGIIRASSGAGVFGGVDLRAADFGFLSDSEAAWPNEKDEKNRIAEDGKTKRYPLLLNRSEYRALLGGAPVEVDKRLDWLQLKDRSASGHPFWPQPYEQLASVYRKMGYRTDAKAVLIRKEKLQRADRRSRAGFQCLWLYPRDCFLDLFTGYGYRPHRSVVALAAFWLLGFAVFAGAAYNDAIKPNNAFILRSPEWAACDKGYEQPDDKASLIRWDEKEHATQLECFRKQPEAKRYPIFAAWLYSLDTLLPVVEMEMQEYWLPDETHKSDGMLENFGKYARWYLWFHIAMGWLFSLFAVAGFSGLIKSD